MTTAILCGMPDEERVLTRALRPGTLILSGTDKFQLAQKIPPSCTRIVSMGLCGGLSRLLAVPDTAVGTVITDRGGERLVCDTTWAHQATTILLKAKISAKLCTWYSSGLFDEADDPGGRAALVKKYNADAIDDESRFAVAEAYRRGIPFNVVRPVSDAWDDDLPLMARGKIMNPDGSPNTEYLISVLGQDQGESSESVFTVAEHYRQSLDALEASAAALSDLLAEG